MNEYNRQLESNKSNTIEYNLEDGLQLTLQRAEKLLLTQDYVVITICGEPNAGKTFFSSSLGRELIKKGINIFWHSSDIDTFGSVPREPLKPKSVVIIGASWAGWPAPKKKVNDIRQYHNQMMQKQAEKIGLPLDRIDIKVAIYSPNKPFELREGDVMTADIVIQNKLAKEK